MKMLVNETLYWCENFVTTLSPKNRNIIIGFQKWVYALCLTTPWHALDQSHISWFTTTVPLTFVLTFQHKVIKRKKSF